LSSILPSGAGGGGKGCWTPWEKKSFKNWLSFFVFLSCFIFFSVFFLFWYESYHKVETGYLIDLKFGTQKGGVRAHLSAKFG